MPQAASRARAPDSSDLLARNDFASLIAGEGGDDGRKLAEKGKSDAPAPTRAARTKATGQAAAAAQPSESAAAAGLEQATAAAPLIAQRGSDQESSLALQSSSEQPASVPTQGEAEAAAATSAPQPKAPDQEQMTAVSSKEADPIRGPDIAIAPDAPRMIQPGQAPTAPAAQDLAGAAAAAPPNGSAPVSGDKAGEEPIRPNAQARPIDADAMIEARPAAPSAGPEAGATPVDAASRSPAPTPPRFDAPIPLPDAAPPPPEPAASAAAPVSIARIPLTISAMAQDGARRFEISLEPAELGRVDVRLDIEADGAVRAHLVVERPEALQLLRRDAHALQQAFADAGLRSDAGGISFGLRQDGSGGGHAAYRQHQETESTSQNQTGAADRPQQPRPPRQISARAALDIFL